jgi:hypothetical protein
VFDCTKVTNISLRFSSEVFDARRNIVVGSILLFASAAFAADMAPSDIQATFFNGKPFTASAPHPI